jgi:two-component system response regulator TctD
MSEAKRILVVEDDDVARELVRRTLARRGYDVTTAADGIEAYDLALKITPDLIITDIHMPAADGAHFVRRVRDTPELMITPILVTTGYGTGSATLTLTQGADAFEPKPVDPDSLLRSVERLLSKEPL